MRLDAVGRGDGEERMGNWTERLGRVREMDFLSLHYACSMIDTRAAREHTATFE